MVSAKGEVKGSSRSRSARHLPMGRHDQAGTAVNLLVVETCNHL